MVVVKNSIEEIWDEFFASLYMSYKTEKDKRLPLYGIDAPTGSGRFHEIQYENPHKSLPLDLYGIDAPTGIFEEIYEILHKSLPLDLYGIDAPTGSFQEMEYEIPHIRLPPQAPGIDEHIGSFQEMKYENSRGLCCRLHCRHCTRLKVLSPSCLLLPRNRV